MKDLLKYLIPILVIAAFSYVAGWSDTASQTIQSSDLSTEGLSFASPVSTPDSDLNSPRLISTGTTHLQRHIRRTVNIHSRSLLEIVKSGKSSNSSVIYSAQRKSLVTNTSIADFPNKLVCLGRLII